jgi:hypothetical protein
VATLGFELEKPIAVSHHPVLANRALAFQPENSLQFHGSRRTPVIVLRFRRHARKPPIVFRQILSLQIHVGHFVTPGLLPPQLFHQPVLMCAMDSFHSPFRLWRTGSDDLDI